jgi:NADPH:quinone reductase
MKAAYIEATGPPEVIRYGDLPRPSPKEGEVLVRVGAVNPIDLYIRAGTVAMPLPKPFILGCDLAGTVEAVGPDAKRFNVGDRVWGSNQGLLGRQGTFAEYACVLEDWLYPTPPSVPDEQAAAVALVGITAHLGLFRCADLQPGETVFVNGGTGGVGSMVLQMGKALGRPRCRHGWLAGQGGSVPQVGRGPRPELQDRRRAGSAPRLHQGAGRQRLV